MGAFALIVIFIESPSELPSSINEVVAGRTISATCCFQLHRCCLSLLRDWVTRSNWGEDRVCHNYSSYLSHYGSVPYVTTISRMKRTSP